MAKGARGRAGAQSAARGADVIVGSGEQFVVLRLHVKPGAGEDAVVGTDAWRSALNVHVKARAKKGEANQSVAAVVAAWFGVRPGDVEIVRGQTSREKTVRVAGASEAQARGLVEALR